MNEDYDVSGHVRQIEQRRPCVSGLENLPDHRTFDVEFSRSGKVLQITNYTGARSIRSFERFVYDGTGRLTRSSELDSQSVETIHTEYAYDLKGVRVGSTSYDSLGRVVARVTEEHLGNLLVSYTTFPLGTD